MMPPLSEEALQAHLRAGFCLSHSLPPAPRAIRPRLDCHHDTCCRHTSWEMAPSTRIAAACTRQGSTTGKQDSFKKNVMRKKTSLQPAACGQPASTTRRRLAVRAGLSPGSCTHTGTPGRARLASQRRKGEEEGAAGCGRSLHGAEHSPGAAPTGLGLELLPQPAQPQRSQQGPSVSGVNRCCALIQNIYLVGC